MKEKVKGCIECDYYCVGPYASMHRDQKDRLCDPSMGDCTHPLAEIESPGTLDWINGNIETAIVHYSGHDLMRQDESKCGRSGKLFKLIEEDESTDDADDQL